MNNVILSCLAFGSAGLLWLAQHNSLEAARAANRVLQQELAGAGITLSETTVATTNAEELLALRRQRLDRARAESVATADATQPTSPLPPDPAREGLWPKDKPYCYLGKKHLTTIGFVPFSEDAALTSEAATLLGMSSAEKAAVDRAYLDFVDRTHQLHLAYAEPVETKAGVNTENHREITYRIPALTNEFRAVRSAFGASLQETLGGSRADIFLKTAKTQLDNAFGQYLDGYTIKYYADRQPDGSVQHQVNVQRLDRQGSYGWGIRFPLEPISGMWKYRHLLGDQPLLPGPAAEPQ